MRMAFAKTGSYFFHSYPYSVFIFLYLKIRCKQRTTINNGDISLNSSYFSGNWNLHNFADNSTLQQFLRSQVIYYANQLPVNPFNNDERAVNRGKFKAIIFNRKIENTLYVRYHSREKICDYRFCGPSPNAYWLNKWESS